MEFCIIAPTPLLDEFAMRSHTHLVLAHVEDPEYWKFYAKMRERGDTLILDNGAYERAQFSLDRYLELINVYRPQLVILPDIWCGKSIDSLTLALGVQVWLQQYLPSQPEYMIVPQALPGDVKGFIQSLNSLMRDEDVKHIGLPRCLVTHIFGSSAARILVTDLIKHERPDIKIHALGMVKGNLHELYYLNEMGVDSIDSSAPVWRGWLGYGIKDPNWPEIPIDFSGGYIADFDKEQRKALIENNLEEVNAIIHTW